MDGYCIDLMDALDNMLAPGGGINADKTALKKALKGSLKIVSDKLEESIKEMEDELKKSLDDLASEVEELQDEIGLGD